MMARVLSLWFCGLGILSVGCTYDYAKFEASDSTGVDNGSGGGEVLSSEPAPQSGDGGEVSVSPAGGSAGQQDGSGGSTQEAVGGSPVTPSENTGGQPSEMSTGGASGSSPELEGAAGTPSCSDSELACSGTCVDPQSTPEHCGGCDNACSVHSGNFICVDGQCGCSAPEDCGGPLNVGCSESLCVCNGTVCGPAEACVRHGNQQDCGCNGGDSCAEGSFCCAVGCRDLNSDPGHCGACERACPAGQACVEGSCEPSA